MRVRELLGVVMVLVFVGCATETIPPKPTGTQYVPPTEVVAGSPQLLTMHDLDSSVQQLMAKMRSNSRFTENYNAIKSAKGKIPLVVIGNIENKTTERLQGRLDAVGDAIRASLYDSGLFDVKDDDASRAIVSRIIRGADDGVEDSSLVQSLGTQDPPDFIVLGDLRHFEDVGGYHTYKLHLAFHNLKTGKVVWEGIQTRVKL